MTFGTLIADTLLTTFFNGRNKRTNSFINITHYPPMANEKEQGQQLQIELTPEIANGTYSNLAIINHSPQEFVLDFIAALPGLPQARVNARQILTPESAKRLLFALQDNVVPNSFSYFTTLSWRAKRRRFALSGIRTRLHRRSPRSAPGSCQCTPNPHSRER